VFGSEDYGGVHTNMSPLCYAFYLLSEGGSGTNDNGDNYNVTAIGIDKASDIMFRLQTVYLIPTSQYHDAWFYAMQVAADLYGACSDEVKAVGDAFYAIGVADEPYVDEVHAGFAASYTEACAPPFMVEFTNTSYNGDNFLWDFGDGSTSTQIHPTHIYNDFGTYTVSLNVDGSACGSDDTTMTDLIVVDESIPCLTLVPSSGNDVYEACSGLIYDNGGPESNYSDNTDGSLTIYAPGSSSIVLNILEFDIEAGDGADCNYDYIAFYDGSSTSDPLINSTLYCNTTGNPETISSTGEYITIRFYSDGGLNMSGFKIQYDCIGNENPPSPYFSAFPETSCDGIIEFNDNSLNFPTAWSWDFGDGNTSDEQNPTHQYLANGTYSVELTVTNAYGENELLKEDYVVVNMPDAPVLGPIQACNNSTFDINLPLAGTAHWYDSDVEGTLIYTGNEWEHPQLDNPVTYYMREVFDGEEYNVGATNNTQGGGYFGNASYIHYLNFDAYSPFILETVEVRAEGAGNRSIALRNSDQQIIEQTTVYCANGVSRITLNFNVPIGEDLQLVGLGAPDLFRTNEGSYLDYPYTIDGIVSITGSSASTGPTDYYYYFYDWEIITPSCKTSFVEVELIPEECTSSIEQELLNNITIAPNPTGSEFRLFGLSELEDYKLIITDISGKQIEVLTDINNEFVNVSDYADGVYFINISSEIGSKVIKLIKQ
jgi:PKD repeat protein